MIKKIKVLPQFFLLSIVLLVFFNIQAQDDLSEKISKNSKITYLDLLQQIFPDVNKDGKSQKTNEIRISADSDEVQTYQEPMQLSVSNSNWITTEKGRRLRLNIKVRGEDHNNFDWGELNLIALFDNSANPQLLDVVDVSSDRENYYSGEISVNPKLNLTMYEFSHLNAGEDFHYYAFFQVENDEINQTLEELPYLYTGTTCKGQMDETGKISTLPNNQTDYRDIIFKIKITYKRFAADCQTVRSKTSKNFTLRMSWRNGKYRYADNGAELKRIQREEKRLGFGKDE
ncbi:MAG: hypothetical protein K1X72_22760 [Pyrinomonadaceae bacterium]|nr:hypothetical protein [Pyrinomonadaceae bacterium]